MVPAISTTLEGDKEMRRRVGWRKGNLVGQRETQGRGHTWVLAELLQCDLKEDQPVLLAVLDRSRSQ